MPEVISVTEFISETNEDYTAPTTSSFSTRMLHCRNTVAALEESEAGEGEAGPRPAARNDPHGVQWRRNRRGDGEGAAAVPAADV
uniref:Uncharacterized protein n=1 Tax=Cynoglossus semilaevis TaxID=244447 RepID=A0A3P8V4P5_CYNSE